MNASCGGGSNCDIQSDGGPLAEFSIFRSVFTLADNTDPVPAAASGSLTQGGVMRGRKGITFNVTDRGSGVYRGLVTVDGAPIYSSVIDDNDGRWRATERDEHSFAYRVPCKLSANATVAFNTAAVPNGQHDVRVDVEDASGNRATVYSGQITTDNPAFAPADAPDVRHPNGAGARSQASLTAVYRNSKRRTVKTRYGRRVALTGTLADPAGRPISGAAVAVLARTAVPGSPLAQQGTVQTDEAGHFRYLAPPGPSRLVRFGYRAYLEDVDFAAQSDIDLQVIGAVRLKTDRQSLRNGQTVRFSGRALGAPSGARKLVALQVKQGRTWRTFATPGLKRRGTFAYRYTFKRTVRTQSYRFRALVRRESGWPFLTGKSRAVKVLVRS